MNKKIIVVSLAVAATSVAALFVFINNSQTKQITAESPVYYALGDSVAAGVGLPTFSDASACGRTNESYPAILARSKGYKLTNLACSGATIETGVNGSQTVNNLIISSQLDQMFALPTPDAVTITIGANDVDWTQYLACYTTDCPADLTSQLTPRLQRLDANLTDVLGRLREQYQENIPNVVVTGYYNLLGSDNIAPCTDTNGLTQSEQRSIGMVFSSLNATLKQITEKYDFARFAPIDFAGHELCSRDPWIQGIADKAPFHPNEAGQSAIAKQLSSVIHLK